MDASRTQVETFPTPTAGPRALWPRQGPGSQPDQGVKFFTKRAENHHLSITASPATQTSLPV